MGARIDQGEMEARIDKIKHATVVERAKEIDPHTVTEGGGGETQNAKHTVVTRTDERHTAENGNKGTR